MMNGYGLLLGFGDVEYVVSYYGVLLYHENKAKPCLPNIKNMNMLKANSRCL